MNSVTLEQKVSQKNFVSSYKERNFTPTTVTHTSNAAHTVAYFDASHYAPFNP